MASSVKTQWVSVILFLTIFLTLLLFCTATAQSGGLSWSLEGPADAVVAHDGGFLALVEGSIWACRPGEQEPALLLPPDGGLPVDGLFAGDAGGVLALSVTHAAYDIYRMDVDTADLALAWRIARQDAPTGYMRQILWQDGQIVIEYQGDFIRKSDLLVFDTATGQIVSAYGCDISGLTPYQEGMLLGAQVRYDDRANVIVTYDLNTGAISPVCELNAFPEALCFDSSTQQIISFLSPNANVLSTSGEPVKQVYVPIAYVAGEGRHCAVNAARLFVVSDANRLLAADLLASGDAKAVQITRFDVDGEETKRFRLSHPEIPVQSVNMGFQLTPAMVSQLIRGNDAATDIYMVRTFEAGYSELLKKGFCSDLSGQEDIYSEVMRMPPALSSALMVDGQLLGVPVEMEFDPWTALSCSYETLDELGIIFEEIPTNLLDLLDRVLEWYQDGTLDGVRLFDSGDQAFSLTWFVLNNYAHYASANSRPLDYDTPLFKSLLEKCDRLCALSAQQSAPSATSLFLFSTSSPKELLSDWDESQKAFLPMPPQPGMPPCYPVFLTVAVLNPLSRNKELALTYLQSLLKELPAQRRLYFWPDQARTAERSWYQEQHQMAVDEIERLQGLSDGDTLDVAGRNEIQLQLADATRWLEELETQQRWELSPDAVSAYLSIKDSVFVPSSAVREMLDEPMIGAVKQYAAGQMESAALVESIIRKARIIQMERGGDQ